jgi:prephenate dehydrogenase
MFNQLGLIGCGLMGGSFALALKKAGLVRRVIGYSKSPSTVEKARRLGVIDAIRHLVDPGVLVMDVGSTKRDVVDAARRVLKERLPSFVPAHPIAGREVAGIEHADGALYQGRKVILTPLSQTDPVLVQKATDVWAAIGCQVLKMSPENHDAAFAAVSHLPHLVAFAYLNAMNQQPAGKEFLSLAGPGFRDFSRIAASDPNVWRDILLSNREEILKQSEAFRAALDAMERSMRDWNGEALEQQIASASTSRSQWTLNSQTAAANKPPSGSR